MVKISTSQKMKDHAAVEHAMEGKFIQLFSHDNVHTYLINPEELGFIKRDTTTVKLVMIPHEDQTALYDVVIPPAFLEAGGWFYPLIPSKTPVYRTEEKYYIFPDLLCASPGASVGIQLPQNTTTEERDLFENILLNLAGLNEFPTGFDTPGNQAASINIIETVLTEPIETQFPTQSIPVKVRTNADGKAEDSVAVGASRTFEFMSYETGEAKFHLGPDYHDPEEHTGILVEITGYGLSRLADATAKLATFTSQYTVSSGTSDGGNAVHDQTANGTSSAQNGVTAATDDARNTLKIVYESLHKIGKTLAYEISHNHVMDHRYGARRSGHIMEYGPKPFATVTHN